MVQKVEAVYENGVLKPLEPLSLEDRQHVNLTITDRVENKPLVERVPFNDRRAEMKWIGEHEHEYRGQWLALSGEQLVSHGPDARVAHRKGIEDPLMHHVPSEPELPSAGLLLL
jgi:predicted DNA-binding antitoxin AbrB/MazE fold protein